MLAALLAVTVGVGLSRFAYSALIPVIVEAGWITPAGAGYLGAANFLGYLLGAGAGLLGGLQQRAPLVLRLSMLAVGLSFLAAAVDTSFHWLVLWRFVAGAAGGVLMVLAAPLALATFPPERRAALSGIVFAGVGVGIIISALVVPVLAGMGPTEAWVGIGLICFAATMASWAGWPSISPPTRVDAIRILPSSALVLIWLVYGLVAVGLVPHMVFLVDLVARSRGLGLPAGALCWLLFGIGALLGPFACGRLAARFTAGRALQGVAIMQIGTVALPAFVGDLPLLALSSLFVGASVSGIVTLTLGRISEIVPNGRRRVFAWSAATIAFAVGQAGGGYLFSFLLGATPLELDHLFLLGGTAFAAAAVLTLLPAWRRRTVP